MPDTFSVLFGGFCQTRLLPISKLSAFSPGKSVIALKVLKLFLFSMQGLFERHPGIINYDTARTYTTTMAGC